MSPNKLLFALAGAALLAIVGYALFAATPYLLGPSLTVIVPEDQSVVSAPLVTVSGKTSRVTYVALNGEPIPLLEDGTFAAERAFPRGYTVLVVEARDRFDRTITKVVRFLHTTNEPVHGETE